MPRREAVAVLLKALLLAGSLVPLVTMLTALLAAVWLRARDSA